MRIRIARRSEERESAVTPREIYRQRREFLRQAGAGLAAGGLLPGPAAAAFALGTPAASPYSTDEALTDRHAATHYNNFYELGYDKDDPAANAHLLQTEPWSVAVDGHCENPGAWAVEDLVPMNRLEERIYRLRCVEAWSMVIPWLGVPLALVLEKFRPTSKARYVAFQTLHDPERLPGQRRAVLDWPYVEGLRMDEAMHPLTLLTVGMYGEVLPNQNGAPIRIVVPWKYGFKSIKSLVRIRFVESQPPTAWNTQAPDEYGFYSNVNPTVNHPRWSQRRERRIGEFRKRKTRMFNGYADEVARLYQGMDLHRHF